MATATAMAAAVAVSIYPSSFHPQCIYLLNYMEKFLMRSCPHKAYVINIIMHGTDFFLPYPNTDILARVSVVSRYSTHHETLTNDSASSLS